MTRLMEQFINSRNNEVMTVENFKELTATKDTADVAFGTLGQQYSEKSIYSLPCVVSVATVAIYHVLPICL